MHAKTESKSCLYAFRLLSTLHLQTVGVKAVLAQCSVPSRAFCRACRDFIKAVFSERRMSKVMFCMHAGIPSRA